MKKIIITLLLVSVLLISGISGCEKPKEHSEDSSILECFNDQITEDFNLRESTQLTVENLKIGFSYATIANYTDESGEEHRGPIAVLAAFVKNKPEENKKLRVYEGQQIQVDEYRLDIVKIHVISGSRNLVDLNITYPC